MNRYNPKQIKWTYMSGLHAESLEKKKKEKKKGGWGGVEGDINSIGKM